ncbi:MAG: SDR family NAD(P)-dependent oxidoreductase [Blastocatellia bacterium]|jgi:3-oxoacyl-[acyl-carrier protein] reductase
MMEQPAYVIFGATGGVGSALARRVARRIGTQRLLLVGRNAEKLDNLSAEIGAETRVADATSIADVDAAIEFAVERFGRVDGVANCVGSLLLKPVHLTSELEWAAVINTNLGSAFAVTRAAAKAMTQTGGSIALVSSAASRIGLANHEAIAAAKGAINGLVLSAAATYGPRGIRVNAVAPGLVRTPLASRITGNDAALKASTAMHVLGRIGEADEVASGLDWLLDPAQSWVTGQIIGIDGGLGSVRSR